MIRPLVSYEGEYHDTENIVSSVFSLYNTTLQASGYKGEERWGGLERGVEWNEGVREA